MKFSSLNPSTRFACSLVCSAVLCFSSVRATAEDFEFDSSTMEYFEFDSDTMRAVTNLALSISGPNATQATVDDNVSSILALLRSSWYESFGSWGGVIKTRPLAGYGYDLGTAFGRGIYDNWNGSSGMTAEHSYLYQLQRALYGRSGVPSSDSAVVPTLLRLFGSATNIESYADNIHQSTSWYLPYLSDLYTDFTLLADEYYNGTWSDAWNVHLSDDSMQMYDYVLSNNLDWLRLEIGSYIGTELKVDLSDITDRQDGQYLFLQGQESDANDEGDELSSTVDDWVADGETADSSKQSEAEEEMKETAEPEMEDYQTASSTSDTSDVDKDDLLDNLSDDNLSHSPIITLIDAEHFKRATGVDGDMEFNMNHGNFGSFVADMSTICRAAWRGLLAIFSALLFWRKQNEISAIVRSSNISRVD